MSRSLFAVVLCAAALLAACGNKGPLVKPDDAAKPAQPGATAPTPTPAPPH
jgi:predicted small lipoprotein YifL